jgi:predicted porin
MNPSHPVQRTRGVRPALAATAIAACIAPLAAQAQASSVTVYGLFDAAVRQADNASTGDRLRTMEDGIMTGSRLGWRGREELGGSMAAVFTMESGFDPSSGVSLQATPTADYGQAQATTRFWGREIHVGLRGPIGGVTLGRQYTVAHAVTARLQPLGNPNSTAHSVFSSHHIARQDNVVKLDGKLGGVEVVVGHTFGEQSGSANDTNAVSVTYSQGPVFLGAYTQRLRNLAGTETRTIHGGGGSFKFNDTLQLFAAAMQRSSAVSPQKNRVWMLGANVVLLPQVTLSLSYFDDSQTGSAALTGARKLSWLSANYMFSKRSDVYVVLDQNTVSGNYSKPAFMGKLGRQNGMVFGMRHRF